MCILCDFILCDFKRLCRRCKATIWSVIFHYLQGDEVCSSRKRASNRWKWRGETPFLTGRARLRVGGCLPRPIGMKREKWGREVGKGGKGKREDSEQLVDLSHLWVLWDLKTDWYCLRYRREDSSGLWKLLHGATDGKKRREKYTPGMWPRASLLHGHGLWLLCFCWGTWHEIPRPGGQVALASQKSFFFHIFLNGKMYHSHLCSSRSKRIQALITQRPLGAETLGFDRQTGLFESFQTNVVPCL